MGRSDTGMTTGWTEGKPWEIAWGAPVGCGEWLVGRSDTGMMTGWTEAVGNSLGRAPVERSDTGRTTGWTEGKP